MKNNIKNGKKVRILILTFIYNSFLFGMNSMTFDSWKEMRKYLPSNIRNVLNPKDLTKKEKLRLRRAGIYPKEYSGANKFESKNFNLDENKLDISRVFKDFLSENSIYWNEGYARGWTMLARRKALDDIPTKHSTVDNIFKVHLQIKARYLYDFLKDFLNNFIYPTSSFCQMNVAGIKAPKKIKIMSKNSDLIEFANMKKQFMDENPNLELLNDKNEKFETFIDSKYGEKFYKNQMFYGLFKSRDILNDYFYKQHIVRDIATIVIYVAKSPEFIYENTDLRQTYLNSFVIPISKWVNSWAENKDLSLADIALDVQPRFNLKINDIVYIAGGNGDYKKNIRPNEDSPFDDNLIFIKDRGYKKGFIPKLDNNFIELRDKEANNLLKSLKSKNFENIFECSNPDTFHKKLFLELVSELKNIDANIEKYDNSPVPNTLSTIDDGNFKLMDPLYKISSLFRSFLIFYKGDNKRDLILSFYDFINPYYVSNSSRVIAGI